jgi:hypothetical protein
VTPGRLVAELHFGFWCSLFDVRYEHGQRLWPWLAQEIAPYAPKASRQRKILSARLNRIRLLRNRIFHYEPIWHWKDLADQHLAILEVLDWMNPSVTSLLNTMNRFPAALSSGASLKP